MDVAVHFEKVVAGFSRYHKYTLGTELRNKSREIVSLIAVAPEPVSFILFVTGGTLLARRRFRRRKRS